MWINVEPEANTTGILSQIEKIKKLAEEVENETYKLREMMRAISLNECAAQAERTETEQTDSPRKSD